MHEAWRVLKPSGVVFVNLGDKRSGSGGHNNDGVGAPSERGPKRYTACHSRGKDGLTPRWTQANAAWLAGVIDCDGCIHVGRPRSDVASARAQLVVEMGDSEVCARAAAITGVGNTRRTSNGTTRWEATGPQARYVLEQIWPWLLIKQKQALAAIEMGRLKEANHGRNIVTPDELTYRAQISEAIMDWNQRRPNPWTPPPAPYPRLPHYEWTGPRAKSKLLLPHRFAIGCEDGLADPEGKGWIVRSDLVWNKPNGLPESVTDRPRDSHEYWFMLTKEGRYYSAVDEVREPHAERTHEQHAIDVRAGLGVSVSGYRGDRQNGQRVRGIMPPPNPLGKLPGSVWNIPSEPLRVPDWARERLDLPDHFACLDDETEILTKRGWLRHDELTPGDEVGGYLVGTGVAQWTKCEAVNRYDYDGELVAVNKRDLSMRLTPNHRCVVRRPHSVRPDVDQIVRADQLGPRHAIPRAADRWPGGPANASWGSPFAALVGWISAEGWYTETGQVRLCQSLTANPEHVEAIDALLAAVPLPDADRSARKKYRRALDAVQRTVAEREWRGQPSSVVNWALPLGLSQQIVALMPDKRLPWSVLEWDVSDQAALFHAFVDGDGHRRPDGRLSIYQKERHNLDVLQAVAIRLCYRTRISEGPGRFILYANKGPRSLTLRGTNGANVQPGREHYKGTVWCPTTGTGTFFARRKGSVFITGNSFPTEWPRRLILGWSPPGVCVDCNEGRHPVVEKERDAAYGNGSAAVSAKQWGPHSNHDTDRVYRMEHTITGYACACPSPTAPTTPAVVLDPFVGTGTVPMVARALGRYGVGIDLSADYLRLARWRTFESSHAAKAINRTHREAQGQML